MGLSSLNCKEKKTIRQSSATLHIQTVYGSVVSDTQAKVYIKEVGAYLLVHSVKDSLSVLLLGRLCNELGYSYSWPTRETPRLSKGKKVIECSIENFVLMVPVTKQKAVPSIEFSTAKGNLERERKRSGGQQLDLLQPSTAGLQNGDASSTTPTAGGGPKHDVVEEQSLGEKLPSVVLQQKIPRVRKVSSVLNQEETTMCSLIIRKTQIVRFVRRQKTHTSQV